MSGVELGGDDAGPKGVNHLQLLHYSINVANASQVQNAHLVSAPDMRISG